MFVKYFWSNYPCFFQFGWFAHPVILGDYPEVMKSRIANRSTAEGFALSRLPKFSEQEVSYIKGTYDYLGINTYTTSMVEAIPDPPPVVGKPSRYGDIGVHEYFLDSWKSTSLFWLKVWLMNLHCTLYYFISFDLDNRHSDKGFFYDHSIRQIYFNNTTLLTRILVLFQLLMVKSNRISCYIQCFGKINRDLVLQEYNDLNQWSPNILA